MSRTRRHHDPRIDPRNFKSPWQVTGGHFNWSFKACRFKTSDGRVIACRGVDDDHNDPCFCKRRARRLRRRASSAMIFKQIVFIEED